ncbi:MAG: hypothetical protein NTW08_06810 [Gammaproteobacteria bacterium]|nr:hypothetical protein [Gammaproteobacteria bacterium]
MISESILYREANLTHHPEHPITPNADFKNTTLTLGDLHGNTMKLLTILIQEGILVLNSPSQYAVLYEIYNTPAAALTKAQLNTFASILKQATLTPPKLLRLLGDDIGDRGMNDYFTFLLIETLKLAGLNLDIIFSNHASVAIQRMLEGHNGCRVIGAPGYNQQQSCDFFWQLVESQLIAYADILALFNRYYLPCLKLIGYQLSAPALDPADKPRDVGAVVHLFTHAPVGLETIKDIAAYFEVDYNDTTPEQLMHTIDAINAAFQHALSTKTLTHYYDIESPQHNPIFAIVWSRQLRDDFTLTPAGDYLVTSTHGHVGVDWTPNFPLHRAPHPVLINLDNMLGKSDGFLIERYPVLIGYIYHLVAGGPSLRSG